MNLKNVKSQSGFSLVELMVVVAIIGVLATISVPKVQGYLSKAKKTEAQNNLGMLYTGEMNYFTDNNVYTVAMAGANSIDFPFGGTYNYLLGFNGNNTKTYCGVNPTVCKMTTGGDTAAALATTCSVTAATAAVAASFIACANANLSTPDSWTINQNRILVNSVVGQ
jgi:type IV pilus assembly protein PilA